jgi:hypothetical protein
MIGAHKHHVWINSGLCEQSGECLGVIQIGYDEKISEGDILYLIDNFTKSIRVILPENQKHHPRPYLHEVCIYKWETKEFLGCMPKDDVQKFCEMLAIQNQL